MNTSPQLITPEQMQRIEREVSAVIAYLDGKHLGWRLYENQMVEFSKQIQRGPGESDTDFVDLLYQLASARRLSG